MTDKVQMTANYHAHTWRCMHATGTEREYVEKAIEAGFKIFGFSDHSPMPYPDGYVSTFKMRIDQLDDYVTTLLDLKKEYAKEIEVLIGLETEYYPDLFWNLVDITKQYPIQYYILGQHLLGNEIGESYCGDPTDDPVILERYCRQCIEGLQTGCFTYFAHPDVIHFIGDPEIYEKEMRKLCQEAKRLNIPLEINFLGISGNRHYPNEAFWKIAGETGNTAIFGADAHSPENVWNPQAYCKAQELASKYGLKVLETAELILPGRMVSQSESEGRSF